MKSSHRSPQTAGIGLRLPHIAEVVATRPEVGWLEIHPENFLANPHAMELLLELSAHYPISVHTVGVSIGSATGINRTHLRRVRHLVERIDPIFVSGHLAWSALGHEYLNDLLPLPFNKESLRLVQMHIDEVQDELGRPYLVENPSSYVGFRGSMMREAEFLTELVYRTGCQILCDISNAYISSVNMEYDSCTYIDSLPVDAVSQLHLGGYTPEDDLLIDTHAAPIADPAWSLYGYAIHRFGSKPALIEWDNEIPSLSRLVTEADHANEIATAATMAHAPEEAVCVAAC